MIMSFGLVSPLVAVAGLLGMAGTTFAYLHFFGRHLEERRCRLACQQQEAAVGVIDGETET
jgi:hypothetical protein